VRSKKLRADKVHALLSVTFSAPNCPPEFSVQKPQLFILTRQENIYVSLHTQID
jgi:hypothetical protein